MYATNAQLESFITKGLDKKEVERHTSEIFLFHYEQKHKIYMLNNRVQPGHTREVPNGVHLLSTFALPDDISKTVETQSELIKKLAKMYPHEGAFHDELPYGPVPLSLGGQLRNQELNADWRAKKYADRFEVTYQPRIIRSTSAQYLGH